MSEVRTRKTSGAIWVVGLLIAGLGWWGFAERTRADELERQVVTLTNEKEELESQVNDLESDKNDLETQVADLEGRVETLTEQAQDLIDASRRLESDTSRFSSENWRDVVPDVGYGVDDLIGAADDLEMELP